MKDKPVTTLFLDIGGVLLTNGWGRPSRELAATKFHLDLEELEHRHQLNFETYEIGKLTLEEYLNRVIFYTKRSFTTDEFREFMFSQSGAFPEMIDMARRLKEKYSLKIAVVSNEGRELNAHRIGTFRLNEFVDFFISSSFVQLRKPDADMFRLALDIAQVSADSVVYIDDQLLFVQVAAGFGIRGVCHLDFEYTREKLSSFGLKI